MDAERTERPSAFGPSQLSPGATFAGKYVIHRLVRAGGMGAVFEGTHRETRRRVAIKVMRPEIVGDEALRQKFVQEAHLSSVIDSDYVVDVLDAGIAPDPNGAEIPFLVMEFLVGEELGDLLKRRVRLSPSEAIPLFHLAARALDKAHQRGVVHRDLKPENLFIVQREDEPPSLKVLDFGIAKVLQSQTVGNVTRATGTPLYMAPEQTGTSDAIGPATDLWAFGLIVYTVLVGRPYWLGSDIQQVFSEILIAPFESAIARAARSGVTLPPEFDRWFFQCVNRDPSKRYVRAVDAINALAVAYGLAPQHPSFPSAEPIAPPSTAPMAPAPHPGSGTEIMAAYTPAPPSALTNPAPLVQVRPPPSPGPRIVPILLGLALVGAAVGIAVVVINHRAPDAPVATTPPSDEDEPKQKEHTEKKPKKVSLTDDVATLNPFVDLSSGFSIHQHEVTRAEYARFLDSIAPAERASAVPIHAWDDADARDSKIPVTWITYERATKYCAAIGARLPTSPEWGAAVGGVLPWGETWAGVDGKKVAVAHGDDAEPIEVASAPSDRTTEGIYDLAGNVEEWTSSPSKDGTPGLMIVRGASVITPTSDATSAVKEGTTKFTEAGAGEGAAEGSIAGAHLGFRCARD